MTIEQRSPIIKTTGSRLAKGIAIIIIVMVVGVIIHIGGGDVWSKYPSLKALTKTQTPKPEVPTNVPVGEKRTFNLVFKESSDLTNLWFEANGEKNPEIVVNLGDEITINVVNEGIMPHAFGVVTNPDDVNSVIFNSAIGSVSNPLANGASGSVTFKVTKAGEYYYICLVPGHALQGMKGKFIVNEPTQTGTSTTPPNTQITEEISGPIITTEENSLTVDMAFKESSDLTNLWFEANGEKNPTIKVKSGTQLTINVVNEGIMPHAFGVVTNPDDVNSVIFNSAIGSVSNPLLSNKSGTVTFIADNAGEYYYICLVPGHALQGMKGKFIVE